MARGRRESLAPAAIDHRVGKGLEDRSFNPCRTLQTTGGFPGARDAASRAARLPRYIQPWTTSGPNPAASRDNRKDWTTSPRPNGATSIPAAIKGDASAVSDPSEATRHTWPRADRLTASWTRNPS